MREEVKGTHECAHRGRAVAKSQSAVALERLVRPGRGRRVKNGDEVGTWSVGAPAPLPIRLSLPPPPPRQGGGVL